MKGAGMDYSKNKQLDLSDRIVIETGLYNGDSFKTIAKSLNKHPTTISNEIKNNRTLVQGKFSNDNDCRYYFVCTKRNVCGDEECYGKCNMCKTRNCHKYCDHYVSLECGRTARAPFVCNKCSDRKVCFKTRYFYSAKYAQAASDRRRSESRQGLRLKGVDIKKLDELIEKLVKKGQPLTHIYAQHKNEIPICLRSLYNYIDSGELTIKNIDLRRKVKYKSRRKRYRGNKSAIDLLAYRKGRTYQDFLAYLEKNKNTNVVEMDTVKGKRERGKRLLTMIFCKTNIMLLFLIPDVKAESIKRVFDSLEVVLGTERFRRLFSVILTDNGSEFKCVKKLEENDELQQRTSIFYCDPMSSWQKPHVEKNHEFIRYVLPRGESLDKYTQKDITKLMNHINSIKRVKLGNKAPYELVDEKDEDMQILMKVLKMHLIPADEVHLKPDLFNKK